VTDWELRQAAARGEVTPISLVSGWVRIRKRSILFITHNKETGLANQELAVSERH